MAEVNATIVSCKDASRRGLSRYFTRLPCPKGHIAERYVASRSCVACAATLKAKWAARRPEAVTAYNKKHYAANADSAKLRSKNWTANNPEKAREYKRREFRRNRRRYAAQALAYRENNKEKIRAQSARKVAANPERYAAYKRNRKARKRNAAGTHTARDISLILNAQCKKCAYCRVDLGARKYHVDHIIPLARGGTNWPRNLQILCGPCNQRKSARDPIEFAQSRGLLL